MTAIAKEPTADDPSTRARLRIAFIAAGETFINELEMQCNLL